MFKTLVSILNNATASLENFNTNAEIRINQLRVEGEFAQTKAGHALRHSEQARKIIDDMRNRHRQYNMVKDEAFYEAEYKTMFDKFMASTAHLIQE